MTSQMLHKLRNAYLVRWYITCTGVILIRDNAGDILHAFLCVIPAFLCNRSAFSERNFIFSPNFLSKQLFSPTFHLFSSQFQLFYASFQLFTSEFQNFSVNFPLFSSQFHLLYVSLQLFSWQCQRQRRRLSLSCQARVSSRGHSRRVCRRGNMPT
jgi:hypothetical protein